MTSSRHEPTCRYNVRVSCWFISRFSTLIRANYEIGTTCDVHAWISCYIAERKAKGSFGRSASRTTKHRYRGHFRTRTRCHRHRYIRHLARIRDSMNLRSICWANSVVQGDQISSADELQRTSFGLPTSYPPNFSPIFQPTCFFIASAELTTGDANRNFAFLCWPLLR